MQVGNLRQPDNAAPSLHLRYKGFVTTTSGSAPCSSIGILPHGVCHLSFPFASGTRFSRSIPEPVLSSCRLYTDCHRVRKQVSSRLIPELLHDPGFDSTLELTVRHRTVRLRSSSQYVPDVLSERLFPSRSRPHLLDAAALGGLISAPASRFREADSHLWYSIAGSHLRS